MGKQESFPAHACSCQCGLSTGMAATDNDYIKFFRMKHIRLGTQKSGNDTLCDIKAKLRETLFHVEQNVAMYNNLLLANTEPGKNLAKQIIRGKFTGNRGKRILRKPQLFGQQLDMVHIFLCRLQMSLRFS